MRLLIALALALLAAPQMAAGQSADDISFKVDKERSRSNKIALAVLGGTAAVFTGVGVLFTLDSQSKSDEVNSGGQHTGLVWTPEREDTRKAALQSRNVAIVAYSASAAVLVGTAIFYIVTDPGEELVIYNTRGPTVTPVDGGAIVGAHWSWQ